ncbi:hypothetical protein ACFYNY_36290 [Streptomyces sp. NPDC006530]|uniref:hypothetical protein n=1 Tax=Streptomyces sp. NPDC006530 TaxID=3364750 RepID=UPI00368FA7F2
MNVTALGAEIDVTAGTLFFVVLSVVGGMAVFRKMAPRQPATATDPSTGERLLAAATAAAAIIAVGTFVTGGVTAHKATHNETPPSHSAPQAPCRSK